MIKYLMQTHYVLACKELNTAKLEYSDFYELAHLYIDIINRRYLLISFIDYYLYITIKILL